MKKNGRILRAGNKAWPQSCPQLTKITNKLKSQTNLHFKQRQRTRKIRVTNNQESQKRKGRAKLNKFRMLKKKKESNLTGKKMMRRAKSSYMLRKSLKRS